MNDQENFDQLVELAMKTPGRFNLRPVIEKELLHYDILFALERGGFLDQLTFQGGTALRLCYGAARFSEDLDFAGGQDFSRKDFKAIKQCIEQYVGSRYGLAIDVKEPKDLMNTPESRDIQVDKWQVRISTSPHRKDLPKQKIKLEVANISAYTRLPKTLQRNYDFLPDGYSDLLILTESLDEILADKLVAFVACEKYIRHRDIWDFQWLKKQGATLNIDYVKHKIDDYRVSDYPSKLTAMRPRLHDIIHGKDFENEMKRFIPLDVQEQTLLKPKFKLFLVNEIDGLLGEVENQL